MIICLIRYTIDPNKLSDFELYARTWMRLIEKYGGTHHGYFVPGEAPPSAAFSFPGLGEDGPGNIAIALFSFPSVEAYDAYRRDVPRDPECEEITNLRNESQCFTKYERTFMRALERQ
ncbi:MAG TPA: NIPSNAP family protein [Pyrinomonadaceae bacterium]|nr:NIPSNAP family protein [Pyrinomonadaceae bacterium]